MNKTAKKIPGLSFTLDKYFFRNLVIAFGVVLFWRGVWLLSDEFLLPNQPEISAIISLFIGLICLYLVDGDLHNLVQFSPDENEK